MTNEIGSWPFVIVSLLYAITAWFMWQPSKGRRLATFIVSLYGIIAICGGILVKYSHDHFFAHGLLPLLHVYISTLILVIPIYRFREGRINAFILPDIRAFLLFAYFIAIVSLVGYLMHLPDTIISVIDAFKHGLFADIYHTQREIGKYKSNLGAGNLPIVMANAMSEVVPFLLFVFTIIKGHRLLKILFVACIIISLLNCVAAAGRNGLVFFSLVISGTVLLFWNLMSNRIRKRVLVACIGLAIVLVSVVITITISRFENREDTNTLDSVLTYTGQPMVLFGEYIYAAKTTSKGDMCFPLFRGALGLGFSSTLSIRNFHWEPRLRIPLGVFYTIVGDFILDFGSWISMALFIVASICVLYNIRRDVTTVELHELFLIYVLFLFVGQGVFYFSYKTIAGNLQVAFLIVSYLFFRLTANKMRRKVECCQE